MTIGRRYHAAALLLDGRVLVAGGQSNGRETAQAELYDPVTGRWSPTGGMTAARSFFSLTVLADGRVLAVGGGSAADSTGTAEVYDPAKGSWAAVAAPLHLHAFDTSTLLANGTVLVTTSTMGAAAELYDPTMDTWTESGGLAQGERRGASATLLKDGRVLVVGGSTGRDSLRKDAEIYDPLSQTWSGAGELPAYVPIQATTRLSNGNVLVAGQGSKDSVVTAPPVGISAQLYEAAGGRWSITGNMIEARRRDFTVTLLRGGRVLAAGGFIGDAGVTDSLEWYDFQAESWSRAGTLSTARAQHSATRLANGGVLIAGGISGGSPSRELASAEVCQ